MRQDCLDLWPRPNRRLYSFLPWSSGWGERGWRPFATRQVGVGESVREDRLSAIRGDTGRVQDGGLGLPGTQGVLRALSPGPIVPHEGHALPLLTRVCAGLGLGRCEQI